MFFIGEAYFVLRDLGTGFFLQEVKISLSQSVMFHISNNFIHQLKLIIYKNKNLNTLFLFTAATFFVWKVFSQSIKIHTCTSFVRIRNAASSIWSSDITSSHTFCYIHFSLNYIVSLLGLNRANLFYPPIHQ